MGGLFMSCDKTLTSNSRNGEGNNKQIKEICLKIKEARYLWGMNPRQIFLQNIAQTGPAPLELEISFAEGIYLFDTAGKKYIDLISGIAVSSLGHRHPVVAQAIKEQVDKYWHTMVYAEFILSPQTQLAQLLVQNLPPKLNNVYFVNSGAEAIEGAMKLAKKVTGRSGFVACRKAYHGSTQGAASLMYPTTFTQPFYPLLPGVTHIEFNKEEDFDNIGPHTAAVILETIQAESGIRLPKNDYLVKLKKRCQEVGALLILDEAQVGMGRTGTLFAFEQYGVEPDILVLAKALGGGMPLGAFIASEPMMKSLAFSPPLGHLTTFGGHPVCCAAAAASLKVLLQEQHMENVPWKEQLFREKLNHPAVKEIRGKGLFLALDLQSAPKVLTTIKKCLSKGLVTDWFLFNDQCLRLAPPLIISEQQIEEVCGILRDCLEE